MEARVLVVEDDPEMRSLLEDELRGAGYKVLKASDGAQALDLLGRERIDVMITDLVMPAMKGDELLSQVRARRNDVPVVIITAYGSIDSAVRAVKAGAYHYVVKPFPMEQLLVTVQNALRERSLRIEIEGLREALGGPQAGIVAESHAMKQAVDLVMRAAGADSPVCFLGESGTGKEVLARVLHAQSSRRERRFLAINCAAIPETLLESQLFGHRRGAFTDARQDRLGIFQEADGGSILLDEIGDMPLSLQPKLLRVLQEKEVHPLGAPTPVRVNVRVMAATNHDLDALVAAGRFRPDLYYRLNVIAVRVPPLRERREDIVPLVAHLIEKHARRAGGASYRVAPEALQAIQKHDWPGNVRQLENVIERAIVLGRDGVISVKDLPDTVRAARTTPDAGDPRTMSAVEREHIIRTLRSVSGNKTAAARLLGMARKTLYRKLQHYRISER